MNEIEWHSLCISNTTKEFFMEYVIFIIVLIIAYPVFMIIAYLLSKVAFNKDEAFSEFEAKRKTKKTQRDKSLAHA